MTLLSERKSSISRTELIACPSVVMRLVQAFGSSAVLAIGAGSLADIYERHERGSK